MARRDVLFARLALNYADHPKIAGLSDAAFRFHITLILYACRYQTDGVIKNPVANRLGLQWDTDVIAELMGNDDENPSLILRDNGDYFLHDFLEMQETRADSEARKARSRENGNKGGRPKTQKEPSGLRKPNPVGNSNGTQTVTQTVTQTKPDIDIDIDIKERTTNVVPKKPAELFDRFWEVFPKERRTNKPGCQQKFAKAIKDGINPESIIEAAKRYRDDPNRESQYTINPHRWLNEAWWDAPPLPQRQTSSAIPPTGGSPQPAMSKSQQFIESAKRVAAAGPPAYLRELR